MGRGRELGLLNLEKRRLWESLVNVYNKHDQKERGRWAGLISVVMDKRTRGNGHE